MMNYFCVSVMFLEGRFHGKVEDGQPEWPPSPLRLFQAIVNANAASLDAPGVQDALSWLERQAPPMIISPPARINRGHVLSVPNNAMDLVARAWSKGNYFGSGDANPATHRTFKRIQPIGMREGSQVHYLWRLSESDRKALGMAERLGRLVKCIFRLGLGTDLVVANAQIMTAEQVAQLQGERWKPGTPTSNTILRAPCQGTLVELRQRYSRFIKRIASGTFNPVDPLKIFDNIGYRTSRDVQARPHAVFELRTDDGAFFAYQQRKLIHIAGMVRHLAIKAMKQSPPPEIDDPAAWVDQYIAGHFRRGNTPHRQLSYWPLPSIGHRYADHAVRRVMVVAPAGDHRLLDHLARHLAGQLLEPQNGYEFGGHKPPTLVRIHRDKVAAHYVRPARIWASVTPVVLPGHNDRRPAKTVRLIEKALCQSGIEQPCTFEWRMASWWPKSLAAYKCDRTGKPAGYILPKYLENFALIHLRLDFGEGMEMPGPIAIGAGRHCGLGLMAGMDESW